MKVKELIEELKKVDPEIDVLAKCHSGYGTSEVKGIHLQQMEWIKDKPFYVEIRTKS